LLYVNEEGEIVYPAAASMVAYQPASHTQRVISEHDDDITCVAQNPVQKNIFASGQTGKNDYAVVFDSKSMKMVAKLDTSKAFNPGGVLGLAFNPKDPSEIAIVGGTDHECSIQVWNWQERKVIASAVVSKKKTHALAWSPNGDIVWMGSGQIKFMKVNGKTLDVRSGILGKKGKIQRFFSIDFTPNGDTLIGTESGMIYRFSGHQLVTKKRAHKGSVRTICATKNGFVSGGKDGNIKVWSYGLAQSGDNDSASEDFEEENFQDPDSSTEGILLVKTHKLGDYTRSVTVNPSETHAYVFEIDGDVIELDLSSGDTRHILHGHSGRNNEVWGLDVSRDSAQPLLCTVGDDGRILLFNYQTRRLLGQIASKKAKFRGVAFSPDVKQLAVTSLQGDLYVISVADVIQSQLGNFKKIDTNRKTDEEIAVVKYSPCGKYLAIGSHDTHIHVYSAKSFKKIADLTDHSASILGLDWSKDSKFIRTVCAAKELLFWNAAKSWTRDLIAGDNGEIEWETENCVFGWGVRGMWDLKKYNDATDINFCDVDFNNNVLAFVDDFGKVNIARYPTLENKVPIDQYLGHCSHVTRCKFSPDSNYLFTIGGGDLCTFQWEVKSK